MNNWEVSWTPKAATLKKIPISAIHDFLTRRGWVEKPSSRPKYRYYEHSTESDEKGKRYDCYFPAADQAPDYPLTVLRFIEWLARFYELEPWAILTELTGGPLAEPVRTSVPA